MEHAVRILYFPLAGESLFYETVWEPLSSRRHSKKLTKACKIHNNLVPDYLKQIFSTKQKHSQTTDLLFSWKPEN